MKTLKQYINESSEYKNINDILQKYTSGSLKDPYDNEKENPKELFQQLYDVFIDQDINLIILNKGKKFVGSGVVIKTDGSYHFDLASGTETNLIPYHLHVELEKNEQGEYFFSLVRIEKK